MIEEIKNPWLRRGVLLLSWPIVAPCSVVLFMLDTALTEGKWWLASFRDCWRGQ